MKKVGLLSILAASYLFGLTNDEILNQYKKMVPPDVSISIESREKLDDFKGYEAIVFKMKQGENEGGEIVFTKDELIFPDIIDFKKGVSAKQEIQKKVTAKKLASTYKSEDKKNIILLGNDPKKETKVVFSDPECPYCRMELAKINDELKDFNLKYILTPVHDGTALEKSAQIYKEVAKAKSDKDKIAILNKYFDKNIDFKEKVSPEEVAKIETLRQKYFNSGVRGTPFVIAERDLK